MIADASFHLNALAERMIRRDCVDFGLPESQVSLIAPSFTQNGVHDFRLAELPALIGDATYLTKARTILDFGCGSAPFVFSALQRGHDAFGIDTSLEKITLAHLKVAANGFERSWCDRVQIGDATRLTFPDEMFDIVTSFQVLEHIPDLQSALFETVRVLKRGGWYVVRAPDYRMSFEPHYRMPWPQFAPPWLAERWLLAMDRPPGGLGTFFYITLPQVSAILAALGCDVMVARLEAVTPAGYREVAGPLTYERMIMQNDADIARWASAISDQQRKGTLDPVYSTELNMVIAARRR